MTSSTLARESLMDDEPALDMNVEPAVPLSVWNTPILLASLDGDLEEVRRLVEEDPGLVNAMFNRRTALSTAAVSNHAEVVRYLLDNGAQVDLAPPERGTRGMTALHWACQDGCPEAVAVLLEYGADAATVTGDGWTPLLFASASEPARGRDYPFIVAQLLAHGCGDVDYQDSDHCTALHIAAYTGYTEVVRVLLGAGADPHIEDVNGDTALTIAANEECVAELEVSRCSSHIDVSIKCILRRAGSGLG
jgi:cytohesin